MEDSAIKEGFSRLKNGEEYDALFASALCRAKACLLYTSFLNYFDASVSVQLSFINQGTQREQAEKAISIPAQEDAFNSCLLYTSRCV